MPESEQENRLRHFASFFKSYMGVMPLITAAVAPILTLTRAIPVFESQKTTLATYAGLLGFLLIAWVFYYRGPLIRAMLRGKRSSVNFNKVDRDWVIFHSYRLITGLLPLGLIGLSIYCFISYFTVLEDSVNIIILDPRSLSLKLDGKPDILAKWGERWAIPSAGRLQLYYLGIFLSAELSFVIMALREYGYGVLGISENEVIKDGLIGERRDHLTSSANLP